MAPLSERELVSAVPAVPDIDSKDAGDPLAASVYVRDIFSFYKRIEGNFRPSPDYMSRQVRPACPTHALQNPLRALTGRAVSKDHHGTLLAIINVFRHSGWCCEG